MDHSQYEDALPHYVHNYQNSQVQNQTPVRTLGYAGAARRGFDSESDEQYEGYSSENGSRKRKPRSSPPYERYNNCYQGFGPGFNTPKTVVASRKTTDQTPVKPKKYVVIINCKTEKLGLKNPIVIQKLCNKAVDSRCVKDINTTRNGDLIVECFDYVQFKQFLAIKVLGDYQVTCTEAKFMNTTIGCIYGIDKDLSEDEVLEALSVYKVTKVQRLNYFDHKEKVKKLSFTLKLFFSSRVLPESILLGFKSYKVKLYVPKVKQCETCQSFWHFTSECKKGTPTCSNCGENHIVGECKAQKLCCANCKGEHKSTDPKCPKKIHNTQIMKTSISEKCSISEARKVVAQEKQKEKATKQATSKSDTKPKGAKTPESDINKLITLIMFIVKKNNEGWTSTEAIVSDLVPVVHRLYGETFDRDFCIKNLEDAFNVS